MPTLLRLIRYSRPFWGKMALSIAAMAGMTVLGLVPPLLLRTLVDQVLGGPRRHELLLPLVGAMLAVQAGNAGLVAAQLWLAHLVSYGFSRHVGYITPGHSAVVRERGPCQIHRRSFQALCYLSEEELASRSLDAA